MYDNKWGMSSSQERIPETNLKSFNIENEYVNEIPKKDYWNQQQTANLFNHIYLDNSKK